MPRNDADRRTFPRFELTCPVTITDSTGKVLLKTRTLNISDGGALLEPQEETIEIDEPVTIDMRVPRSTANTFMYEDVSSPAQIIRSQEAADLESYALMFIEPVKLDLGE